MPLLNGGQRRDDPSGKGRRPAGDRRGVSAHFTLSADDIREDDANFKMNPPLRSREDVEALRKGLKDGVMDVIATDHAPHGEEEKSQSMMDAPFGIVGLETSAALTYTELVKTGILSIMDMAEKMSYNPAKILGLAEKGSYQKKWTQTLWCLIRNEFTGSTKIRFYQKKEYSV